MLKFDLGQYGTHELDLSQFKGKGISGVSRKIETHIFKTVKVPNKDKQSIRTKVYETLTSYVLSKQK